MTEPTARHTNKKSGKKAAMHKQCQGISTQGLMTRAARQTGLTSIKGRSVAGTLIPGQTHVAIVDVPVVVGDRAVQIKSSGSVDELIPPIVTTRDEEYELDVRTGVEKSRCDSCGKDVRVRKNGALYAHKCSP